MNRDINLPLTETTYYILLALLEPAHGYIIMQKVEELSSYQVKIAAGTLYGAIENLLKQKLIESVQSDDARRKVYIITQKGKEVLKLDFERMNHMLSVTKGLIEF
jgi:DNA-binding PadR family transcriptional regulator